MRFYKGIQFKDRTCQTINGNSYKLDNNQIALYIVLTRKCTAHCRFCEFTNKESNIDTKQFKEVLKKLCKITDITTVHFTGGEPTLEIEKLKQLCKIIKAEDRLITTSVNTNGTNLSKLENIEELDNIALSRHAIDDKENQSIFQSEQVPSAEDIKKFRDKSKLHLSCNLIKNHIDNPEKIINYLEFASTTGVNDIGIVSLMKINKYCKERYVDFSKIELPATERLINNRCYKNIDNKGEICCKCENYLYLSQNNNMISLYHRYAIKNTEIEDYLVYENDKLKQGFNGPEIDIEQL